MPLTDAFEQVAAQATEPSAKLARTIIRAMRNVLEIMVLSSSWFLLAFGTLLKGNFPVFLLKKSEMAGKRRHVEKEFLLSCGRS
jgi:hypothetical protein